MLLFLIIYQLVQLEMMMNDEVCSFYICFISDDTKTKTTCNYMGWAKIIRIDVCVFHLVSCFFSNFFFMVMI